MLQLRPDLQQRHPRSTRHDDGTIASPVDAIRAFKRTDPVHSLEPTLEPIGWDADADHDGGGPRLRRLVRGEQLLRPQIVGIMAREHRRQPERWPPELERA